MAELKPGLLNPDHMTYVQDAAGVVQPDQVPKHWVGTALLPSGWKVTTKKPGSADGDDG